MFSSVFSLFLLLSIAINFHYKKSIGPACCSPGVEGLH